MSEALVLVPKPSKSTPKPAKAPAQSAIPALGSVYTFRSEDGFHGAIRIAKVFPAGAPASHGREPWTGACVGYVTTPYFDKARPELSDPRLRETFIKTFGAWRSVREAWRAELPVGEDFALLGVLSWAFATAASLSFSLGSWEVDHLVASLRLQREFDEPHEGREAKGRRRVRATTT